MEVLGNLVMTIGPQRWIRRVPPAAIAGLALVTGCLVTGCTAKTGDTPAGATSTAPSAESTAPTGTAPTGAAAPADLEKAAAPALDLVQRYVPSGYATQAVVSGYDWATHTGQAIVETLQGSHLLQIACSGDGEVSAVVRVAKKSTQQSIACGKEVSVPFEGALDAVIDGRPGNTGVVAWRVLAPS
jgi:hypothetical protein